MPITLLTCQQSYLFALGVLSLLGRPSLNGRAHAHLSWILVFVWTAYAYRIILPFAINDPTPVEAHEGALLWAKLSILSISGVIIPLFVPRKYRPMDPKNTMEPNPEQITSFASLITFTFLTPIVWLAYSMPHLPFALFPPLPDYDHLRNLIVRGFPHLDPMLDRSRRHFGLKLIKVFWVEILQMISLSIVVTLTGFAAPISINNLLSYLEGSGTRQTIKPWVWVALLFVGRTIHTVSEQWLVYINSRVSVRVQALVTELVFEHALRIRMKAETSDTSADTTKGEEDTPAATTEHASQLDAEHGEVSEVGDEETTSATTHTVSASSTETVGPINAQAGTKGKDRAHAETAVPTTERAEQAKAGSEKDGGKNLIGRLNNLVSSDLSNMVGFMVDLMFITFESPIQITLTVIFLYQILGWSAFVGLATVFATLPVPGYITKLIQGTQREKMQRTDDRVQFVTEMLGVIRMVKLFGWEPRVAAQMDEKREAELVAVRKNRMLGLFSNLCNYLIPVLVMLSTFATYTVFMKGTLTASKVFSSMAVFDVLRIYIMIAFGCLTQLVQSNVSIERLQDFLNSTELIDEFAVKLGRHPDGTEALQSVPEEYKDTVGIRHAAFSWANESTSLARGKINLVVGPTGAGKTSLLMALLGEMHYIPSGPDSSINLPRARGVAYAAQESWVQNDTIRNNIVFVLTQCALKRDLDLFDAGDQTEWRSEAHSSQARITLARAVYSGAEILLLDDVLAALDVHTARWIVDQCLKGDLVRGRTVILVTHNVALASPIADFVVGIGSGGRIVSQGTLSTALAQDPKLLQEIKEEHRELETADNPFNPQKPEDDDVKQRTGKLVVEEEIEAGHLGWNAVVLYVGNMSKRPLLFWLIYTLGHVFRHATSNLQTWYLGYWAAQYETHLPEEVNVAHYLTTFILTVLIGMVGSAFCVFWFVYGSLKAARIIHAKLLTSILSATLRWLDKTPTGRIIARCTEDVQAVDNRLAQATEITVETIIFLILKMVAIVIFSPVFLVPVLLVAVVNGLCGHIYINAQLSVKRELSKAKAPVLGHFGAAINGITSIRAYGAQGAFKAESYRRIDKYSQASILNASLNRWLSIRIEFIGTLFTTGLAVYLTYVSKLSASNTGFSLAMAASFSSNIFVVERILQYLQIDHEPEPTPSGVPPAYWPASGKLEVKDLCARYSEDGPRVLHDVAFEVSSGERVGIVGRTGSGKSSLTLALLRCILTEGTVRYDGLPTDKLNLDALRSNITIIPQSPELLRGTLRQNLDPFSEHDDAVLNDALRSAGLFNLRDETDESRITLDTQIAGGGANLSVGQRQILALARAILRRSKLLILDEATSAIDYETDSIIQRSLRTELGKDVTLLTVAHRLQTIMDAHKIMVLDAGRIVEFGMPSDLLKNEKGLLRALVDESSDRETLYAMAAAASSHLHGHTSNSRIL
ncbi:P-loop containing nucleoside triphosphate hydrolase protein [Fomes fomentarius]|nr:P-loop containing nucleoside triphosphate hydrolase protein [Fomes fomentarius]